MDKACFQHDTAYGDFTDVSRRNASDKVLRDEAFIIVVILSMIDINFIGINSI